MSREFYNILAGIADKPVVNIQSFKRIGESNFYSMIFASAATARDYPADAYDSAIADMTDNRLRIEAGSLFPVASNTSTPLFRCILASQTASLPYSEKAVEENGLIPIQANTFADENDNVWSLVGDGSGRRLVQVTQDDFDGILEAKRVRNPVVASFDVEVPVSEGDYVFFLNTASGEMDFGFAVSMNGQDRVFSRNDGRLHDIEAHAVVQAADVGAVHGSPLHKKMEMIASSAFDKNAFIDYMRTLYGGSDMIKDLERAIRSTGVK